MMLCHRATRKETNFDGSFVCKFKLPNGELCGFKGKTQHYLSKHKDEEKHKIRVNKKSNEPAMPKERKKAQKQAKKKPENILEEMENILEEEESDFYEDELGEEEELRSSDEDAGEEEDFIEEEL